METKEIIEKYKEIFNDKLGDFNEAQIEAMAYLANSNDEDHRYDDLFVRACNMYDYVDLVRDVIKLQTKKE